MQKLRFPVFTCTIFACSILSQYTAVNAQTASDQPAKVSVSGETGSGKQNAASAILQSFSIKRGGTIEIYSDGLRVRVDRLGNRTERLPGEEYELKALVPSSFRQPNDVDSDEFIKAVVHLLQVNSSESSMQQSRLYQYAKYYAELREGDRAEELATEYFALLRALHADGTPVTAAEIEQRKSLLSVLISAGSAEMPTDKPRTKSQTEALSSVGHNALCPPTLQCASLRHIIDDAWCHPKFDAAKDQTAKQSASYVVFFDSAGEVIETRIRKSCGVKERDEEITKMLEKAFLIGTGSRFNYREYAFLLSFPAIKIEKLDDLSF